MIFKMLDDNIKRGDYATFLSRSADIKTNSGFGLVPSSLETQIMQNPELEEVEDPPETLHTPWGIWLHSWDALHGIDQRYDTEHVLRTARAADDILHYYHYVPIIGENDHIHKTYEMNIEYDYSHEEPTYNANINLEEEDVEEVETIIDIDIGEEDDNLHIFNQDEEHDKDEKEVIQDPKGDFKFDEELAKIFERALKIINN
jgi:hypothetical protein|tara:strand:- start:492 stop:1097 length:606 start_codon:yes stop_codon:yes gene_type:complete